MTGLKGSELSRQAAVLASTSYLNLDFHRAPLEAVRSRSHQPTDAYAALDGPRDVG